MGKILLDAKMWMHRDVFKIETNNRNDILAEFRWRDGGESWYLADAINRNKTKTYSRRIRIIIEEVD